jgi:hypothetical protein
MRQNNFSYLLIIRKKKIKFNTNLDNYLMYLRLKLSGTIRISISL